MKDINKIFIFILLLALTSCNKRQKTFTLKVIIKDFYTQSPIPNKTINLYSVKNNYGLMPSDIIETQTTDSQGQATFLNVPVNNGKVSYRIQTPQSADYSSSEYIHLDKNSELVLSLYPLLTKKVTVKKPSSIAKYNIFVSSEFYNNDAVFNDTSATNSFYFKFVPGHTNQILIGATTTINAGRDSLINITPTQNDTSTIKIDL